MNKEEEKKEDESNNSNFGNLSIFNKIFKNTKNVEIDFIDSNFTVKKSQKNIKNNESFNLNKYKEYLLMINYKYNICVFYHILIIKRLMSKKINIEENINNEIEKGNNIS